MENPKYFEQSSGTALIQREVEFLQYSELLDSISLLLYFLKSLNLNVTIIIFVCNLTSHVKALTFMVHLMSQRLLFYLLGEEASIFNQCLTEINGT